MPILDYQLQQEKIIPRIAETFALVFSVKYVLNLSEFVLS